MPWKNNRFLNYIVSVIQTSKWHSDSWLRFDTVDYSQLYIELKRSRWIYKANLSTYNRNFKHISWYIITIFDSAPLKKFVYGG